MVIPRIKVVLKYCSVPPIGENYGNHNPEGDSSNSSLHVILEIRKDKESTRVNYLGFVISFRFVPASYKETV